MENASKALVIAASILIGLILLAIFFYELSYVSSTTKEINANMKRKEILEFNTQFEAYADTRS